MACYDVRCHLGRGVRLQTQLGPMMLHSENMQAAGAAITIIAIAMFNDAVVALVVV